MTDIKEKDLAFIQRMLEVTGEKSVSGLAKKSGLSQSTLNRFVNPNSKHQVEKLEPGTKDKIAKYAGFKSYEDWVANEFSTSRPIKDSDYEIIRALSKQKAKELLNKNKIELTTSEHEDLILDLFKLGLEEFETEGKAIISYPSAERIFVKLFRDKL